MAVAAALAISLAASSVAARSVDDDFQPWLQVFFDGKVTGGVHWSLDLQSRWLNVPRESDAQTGKHLDSSNTVVLVRPALGWPLTDWAVVWAGYCYQPVFYESDALADTRDVDEHRAWEQLSLSHSIERWRLGSRSRLEERYRTKGPGDGQWAYRFRQQARMSYDLTTNAKWQAILSDEVFFNLNDTNYRTMPGLDQNRAFIGLGIQPLARFRVEVGYLNQFVRRYSGPHLLNHILAIQLIVNVPPLF